MARRTEEHQEERREQSQSKVPPASSSAGKKRKPRGALFHGDDPTLAKRAEEELRALRALTLVVDTGGLLSILDGKKLSDKS